jgi:hypothetical protein
MVRPRIISIICIIGYISVVLGFPQIFSPQIKKLGVFMPAIYGILVSLYFIACVGIWYFKQWGVELFLITFFAKILFFVFTNQFDAGFYFGNFISIVSIIILLRFYRRMNPNL